jgi:hypothetical protein
MSGSDTWGIPSTDFLRWYLLAAVLAILLTMAGNWIAAHRSTPVTSAGRVLTPPEVGVLTSDTQAVMAALAILRGAEIIDSQGKKRRDLTAPERSQLDWFTRTVLERLGSGSAVTRAFPVLFVIAVGIARIVAGTANGKPVWFLVAIVFVLFAAVPVLLRRRRRTAAGDTELRRLRAENDYLSPRARPSFTAYGPTRAGMSAAIFGAGALLMLDPAMAGALSYGTAQAGGAASFGFGGDSGGSGGDGGSSSCGGGGGGCGGGGCGG